MSSSIPSISRVQVQQVIAKRSMNQENMGQQFEEQMTQPEPGETEADDSASSSCGESSRNKAEDGEIGSNLDITG
jgi:hypothetical protein